MICDIFVFILISYQYPPFYTLTVPYSAVALVPSSLSLFHSPLFALSHFLFPCNDQKKKVNIVTLISSNQTWAPLPAASPPNPSSQPLPWQARWVTATCTMSGPPRALMMPTLTQMRVCPPRFTDRKSVGGNYSFQATGRSGIWISSMYPFMDRGRLRLPLRRERDNDSDNSRHNHHSSSSSSSGKRWLHSHRTSSLADLMEKSRRPTMPVLCRNNNDHSYSRRSSSTYLRR